MTRQSVHRIWKAFGLQPHHSETFKLSTDPQLTEKIRDTVALYLDPPERVLVLCADEKSQIQALDRTLLAVSLGAMSGFDDDQLRDTFCVALLGSVGCVLDGAALAKFLDDDSFFAGACPRWTWPGRWLRCAISGVE